MTAWSRRLRTATLLCLFVSGSALAQGRRGGNPPPAAPPAAGPATLGADSSVVTHGEVRIGNDVIRYTATTGMLPIRNQRSGETEGRIFYVAYQRDGTSDPATRPLTFLFNGGPGSSSVWLHLGAFGPKRVHLNPDGTNPPPPYAFEDNPSTLLDQTDMVFIDPVGTGFSRPSTAQDGPKFWGLDQDMQSVAEFIRLYLTRNARWASPRFIGGESYGTTRAAHLSGYLTDQGIGLNGVILISAVLNFENSRPAAGNDIGYIGFFPSYALTAWYHQRLGPELQRLSAADFARQVREFTRTEYAPGLFRGAAMSAQERQAFAEKIARLTGMTPAWVLDNDFRFDLGRFSVALLHDQGRMTGRLDSRFTAFNPDPGAEATAFDPSNASIRLSFTPVMNDYARRVLHYESDDLYYILGGGIGPWQYDQGRFPNVVPSLERAFNRNPYMKLYVALGYFDMATPFGAVEYTLDHMALDAAVRAGNIKLGYFEAGHMMYIDQASMAKLRADLRAFLRDAAAH